MEEKIKFTDSYRKVRETKLRKKHHLLSKQLSLT